MGIAESKEKKSILIDFNEDTQKWLVEKGYHKQQVSENHFVYTKGLLILEIAQDESGKLFCIVSTGSRFIVDTDSGELYGASNKDKIENIGVVNKELADQFSQAVVDYNEFYKAFFDKENA